MLTTVKSIVYNTLLYRQYDTVEMSFLARDKDIFDKSTSV